MGSIPVIYIRFPSEDLPSPTCATILVNVNAAESFDNESRNGNKGSPFGVFNDKTSEFNDSTTTTMRFLRELSATLHSIGGGEDWRSSNPSMADWSSRVNRKSGLRLRQTSLTEYKGSPMKHRLTFFTGLMPSASIMILDLSEPGIPS